MKCRSSSSFRATPIERLNASGQRAPPLCSSVAASAQSTASAIPGALVSGSRRNLLTAATTARAVRGEDDNGTFCCANRAAFGDRDLEVGQEFKQEGLELLIGAIDFVDQQ